MATFTQRVSTIYNRAISATIRGLSNIKCKQLTRCTAICHMNKQQCPKYSEFKYCDDHHRIRREFCRLYHLFYYRRKYHQLGVALKDIYEVEIRLRQLYQIMFQLPPEENHILWTDYLSSCPPLEDPDRDNVYLPHYYPDTINEWLHAFPADIIIDKFPTTKKIRCRRPPPQWDAPRLITPQQILLQHFYDNIFHEQFDISTQINGLDLATSTEQEITTEDDTI